MQRFTDRYNRLGSLSMPPLNPPQPPMTSGMFDHMANSSPTSKLPDYRIRFGSTTSTEPDSTDSPETPSQSELLWQDYVKQPDQRKLRALSTSLQPVIDKAVASYAGDRVPPTVRDRARLMAIEAIEKYKPGPGNKLDAYVMTSLRSLRRETPKITSPMAMSQDSRQQNARVISQINELADNLGREPSDEEIQDATNMPLKQVIKIRRRLRAQVPLSMWESKFEDEDGEGGDIATSERTPYDDWMDAVYYDLGPMDRLIMQYRSGYRKSDVLSNQEIARKLKLTPQAVSARAAVIQNKLDEFHG